MWLNGVSPLTVLPAFVAAVAAFVVFGPLGALCQQRFQPILAKDEPGHPLQWRRIWIVAFILAAAVADQHPRQRAERRRGDRAVAGPGALGGHAGHRLIGQAGLVGDPARRSRARCSSSPWSAAASLMPVGSLPDAVLADRFGLGLLSSVFDNIPLTVLALQQGGYDWALLAYAVGFGGSMVWFGSSAGVALTNLYPEGRSVVALAQAGVVRAGRLCRGLLRHAAVAGLASQQRLSGWIISICATGVCIARACRWRMIADEVGTPVYVYSAATLRRHARVLREALAGSTTR